MTILKSSGFTLTESLVTVLILGLLTVSAQPALGSLLESRRVAGAADALLTILQLARSESVTQMRPMVVSYAMNGTTVWGAGLRDADQCNPTIPTPDDPEACSIQDGDVRARKVIDYLDYPGVAVGANRPFTRFEPLRATAHGSNATVTVSGSSGKEIRVIVAPIGRVRACSPDGPAHVSGFAAC